MKKHFLLSVILTGLFFSNYIYSQLPQLEWVNQIGGTGEEDAEEVITDEEGNIITLGGFFNTVDFDPSSTGTAILNSPGLESTYLAKYSPDGEFIWVKGFTGSSNCDAKSLFQDNENNFYITGFFKGTIDFDPSSGVSNLVSTGNYSIFVVKLNSNGNFIWAKKIIGPETEIAWGVFVDSTLNVYLTGNFRGKVDFDPGTEVADTFYVTTDDTKDIFILKLDSNGDFLWVNTYDPEDDSNTGCQIYVDSEGNILASGTFDDIIDFNPSSPYIIDVAGTAAYLLKLDPDGNFIWAKCYGKTGADVYPWKFIIKDDAVYMTGYFIGNVDFSPSSSEIINFVSDNVDIFIAKLDLNGNIIWVKAISGTEADYGQGVCIDNSGNLYITGTYMETADFDPSESEEYYLTSNGNGESFLLKLDNDGNFIYAYSFGGIGEDGGSDILNDDSENIIMTGRFSEEVDFNPAVAYTTLLNSEGSYDSYLMKLNQNGTSVSEIKATGINVYPNPVLDEAVISSNELLNDATVTLKDLHGRTCTEIKNINGHQYKLSMIDRISGIYFVEIINGGNVYQCKIVRAGR